MVRTAWLNYSEKAAARRSAEAQVRGANPMSKKITWINERSEEHVTFRGVSNKCIFFMMTLIIGILLAVGLQHVGVQVPLEGFELEDSVIAFSSASNVSLYGLAASVVIMVVVPFLAFLLRRTAAVCGTIYCISIGYFYSFMTMLIVDYRAAVGIAAAITVLVSMVLNFLVRTGKVTVSNKMNTVLTTLVLTSIVGALLLAACSVIPSLSFVSDFFMGNSLITYALSAAGIVIACLFMMMDIKAVELAIEKEVPKEYEWYCAFSLVFSVIYLFGRILNLVMRLMKNSRNPMMPH